MLWRLSALFILHQLFILIDPFISTVLSKGGDADQARKIQ